MLSRLRAFVVRALAWTPLSLLGLGALLGSLLIFRFYAWPREDHVARVALAAISLAVLQSSIVVSWAAWRTRRWLHDRSTPPTPIHMQAERGEAEGLRMPRFGHWLGVRIEAVWTDDRVRSKWRDRDGDRLERLSGRRRGRWSSVERLFSVESVFGLARVSFRHRERREIRVTPWSGPGLELPDLLALSAGEAVSQPSGRPLGDRVDMRAYSPGDPPRWLLWKVFARTGELMVRTPEAAGDPQVRWALYLVNAPDDEAGAGVAADLIRRGRLGRDWAFGCDAHPGPLEDELEALSALESSADTDRTPGQGLGHFLSKLGDARLIVLAPPTLGVWTDALRSLALRTSAVVWVVSDGPQTQRAAWFYEPEDSPRVLAPPEDRNRIQSALAGRPLAFLNRRTGRRAA
ncbi:MAG: DUF58 domain-containing protein [Myxococcota bacterium]